MELKVITRQDKEDDHLTILIRDHDINNSKIDDLTHNIIQIISIGSSALGLSIGYVLTQQIHISLGLAWLAPLFFLLIYAIIIFETFQLHEHIWTVRILEQRINMLLPEITLTQYIPEFPATTFSSARRGNPKIKLIFLVVIGISALLFITVTVYDFRVIYTNNHFAGTIYSLAYTSLISIELFAFTGVFIDLPKIFRVLSQQISYLGRMPTATEIAAKIEASHRSDFRSLFYKLIPRPLDFFTKGVFFLYGFVLSYIAHGINSDKLELVNRFFSTSTTWKVVSQVPIWTIGALGLVYFILEEYLLQQAKLLWDDIRDIERDKALILNKKRALASGVISINEAINQIIIRLAVAFAGAYLLGGIELIVIFLVILLHQITYVLWAKPRGQAQPVKLLSILSFNNALRFLAGVISVTGSRWASPIVILFFVLFYFQSFGGLAFQWRVEAEDRRDNKQEINVRPQSAYYLQSGCKWQHLGLFGTIVIGVVIIAGYSLNAWSRVFLSGGQVFWNWNLDYIDGTIVIMLLIGVLAVFAKFFLWLLSPLGRIISKVLNVEIRLRVESILSNVIFLLGIIDFIRGLVLGDIVLLAVGLSLLGISYLLFCEHMNYLDYTFDNLTQRLATLKKVLYSYWFSYNSKVNLITLLRIIFTDEKL